MLLCAQYVIPITSDVVREGAVLVRDGCIKDIGQAEFLRLRYPDEEAVDYGMAAIIPGMVDLNTHLENTALRGVVPDQPYTTWVQEARAAGSALDAHDWHASSVLGGLEALSGGITCVADISASGASCATMQKLGLRGVVYREVGARDNRRVADVMAMARNDIVRWAESVDAQRIRIGIAPRETYDCHPLVFQQAAQVAREENIPLAINVAGSREEYDFIRYGSSALSVEVMAEKRGFVEVPPWLPTGVSPVKYVLNWGGFEADNVLAVHCVHVDGEDIKKLHEYNVAVAVCPRCNAQLAMGVAPVLDFLRSGLRVGLGTGYASSTNSSDLIREMRVGMLLIRAMNPGRFIDAFSMLRMATIEGAAALRMEDQIGSIEIGKRADLVAIDLSDTRQSPSSDPIAAVVSACSAGDVAMTMVDGVVRYEKDNWHVDMEVARDIARVIEIRGKLRG